MGLDTYIFRTTKEERIEKMTEILNAREKDLEKGIPFGDTGLYMFIGDTQSYIHELKPDIYWRKYNHITAWFSEKVLKNPRGTIKNNLGILGINELICFRNDCKKVLDKCEMPDGKIKIDKNYCKKIFPCLTTIPFAGNSDYNQEFIEDVKTALSNIDTLLLMCSNADSEFILLADY